MGMRLALSGGLFSGKSTLARALADRGYRYVNYTDYLKQLYVRSLQAVGVAVTLPEVIRNKEDERPHIISFGTRIGFDRGNYVEAVLREQATEFGARDGMSADIVFDNARFDAQMEKLVAHGFRLVRVTTPLSIRRDRALQKGLTLDQFQRRMDDMSERPLRPFPGEVAVEVYGPMHAIIETLNERLLAVEAEERRKERAAHVRVPR